MASTPRDKDGLVFPLLLGKRESDAFGLEFLLDEEVSLQVPGAHTEDRAEGQVRLPLRPWRPQAARLLNPDVAEVQFVKIFVLYSSVYSDISPHSYRYEASSHVKEK